VPPLTPQKPTAAVAPLHTVDPGAQARGASGSLNLRGGRQDGAKDRDAHSQGARPGRPDLRLSWLGHGNNAAGGIADDSSSFIGGVIDSLPSDSLCNHLGHHGRRRGQVSICAAGVRP
jgi:hypothetical protein